MSERNQYLTREEWLQFQNNTGCLVDRLGNFELRSQCDIKVMTEWNYYAVRKNRWTVWDLSTGAIHICADEETARHSFKAWTT